MLQAQSLQVVKEALEPAPASIQAELPSQWFVVRTEPRKERQAAGGLIGHRIKTYLPEIRHRRLYGRKMRTILVPMLPCYLFVKLPIGVELWSRIRATPGVMASDPVLGPYRPIAAAAVEIIRSIEREETEGPAPRTSLYKIGDPVQVLILDRYRHIVDSFTAEVRNIAKLASQGRAKVAREFMGRLVEFDVEISQLRPA